MLILIKVKLLAFFFFCLHICKHVSFFADIGQNLASFELFLNFGFTIFSSSLFPKSLCFGNLRSLTFENGPFFFTITRRLGAATFMLHFILNDLSQWKICICKTHAHHTFLALSPTAHFLFTIHFHHGRKMATLTLHKSLFLLKPILLRSINILLQSHKKIWLLQILNQGIMINFAHTIRLLLIFLHHHVFKTSR